MNKEKVIELEKIISNNYSNIAGMVVLKDGNTLYENYNWEIFSVYSIDSTTDYLYTYFENDDKYEEFLNMIKTRSNIKFSAKPTKEDKIITLSTCLNGDRRLVVHAKLVK